jgi:hypothetical protein
LHDEFERKVERFWKDLGYNRAPEFDAEPLMRRPHREQVPPTTAWLGERFSKTGASNNISTIRRRLTGGRTPRRRCAKCGADRDLRCRVPAVPVGDRKLAALTGELGLPALLSVKVVGNCPSLRGFLPNWKDRKPGEIKTSAPAARITESHRDRDCEPPTTSGCASR